MSDTKQVKCARCDLPLKGPADPKPESVFACPGCGESDTLDNIMREVKDQVTEQAAQYLQDSVRDAFRGSKNVKFTSKPIPKRAHRFTVDLDLH